MKPNPLYHRCHSWPRFAALLVLTLAAGCATRPEHSQALDDAHRLYAEASARPDVAGSAQLELERARVTLSKADQAWADRHDNAETDHLAYVASQQTRVAINVATQKANDAAVNSAPAQRETAQAKAQAQQAQANAQSANERADQLQQELAELSAKRTDQGVVVVLQDVLFDVGKATLQPGAQRRIDRLASVLKNHPDQRVLIEGFTDSTGSDEMNDALSEHRAQAVRDALASQGVSAERIEARGFGKSRPVASNATSAGRQRNRRVEVVFLSADRATADH